MLAKSYWRPLRVVQHVANHRLDERRGELVPCRATLIMRAKSCDALNSRNEGTNVEDDVARQSMQAGNARHVM